LPRDSSTLDRLKAIVTALCHRVLPFEIGRQLPWIEGDTIRETTLICFDDEQDREALRRVGRMLYHLALEATRIPPEESETRRELRAASAELRFVEGYLAMVYREHEESSLPTADGALSRLAGRIARKVGALAERIEESLS
jgi:hypothetical protein